jgi:hypothetical protein
MKYPINEQVKAKKRRAAQLWKLIESSFPSEPSDKEKGTRHSPPRMLE